MNRALCLTLGVITLFTAGCASVDKEDVVKIGHVAPLSGPIAHLGRDNEFGARLAIDELNAKEITIGGKKARFVLVTEDDAADPRQGTRAAARLVDAKVAGVVGHLNSGTSIPASRIYHDAGIPQITPSATNPRYTQQGFQTAFRLIASDQYLGRFLGRYAVEQLHARTIAVIDDRTAYGQGIAEEFASGAEHAGGKVVVRQYTNNRARDFSFILQSVKDQQPDVIFFGGMDDVAGAILRQMKLLGIEAKFIGGDGICTNQLSRLADGAEGYRNVFCAEAGGVDDARTAEMDEFKAKFRNKFQTDVQLYAPNTYDAVNLMVAAMVQAGSSEPSRYLPYLAKTHAYHGVAGDISFDRNGDIQDGPVAMFTYSLGKRTKIGVFR